MSTATGIAQVASAWMSDVRPDSLGRRRERPRRVTALGRVVILTRDLGVLLPTPIHGSLAAV